jgi:hypothetical protein
LATASTIPLCLTLRSDSPSLDHILLQNDVSLTLLFHPRRTVEAERITKAAPATSFTVSFARRAPSNTASDDISGHLTSALIAGNPIQAGGTGDHIAFNNGSGSIDKRRHQSGDDINGNGSNGTGLGSLIAPLNVAEANGNKASSSTSRASSTTAFSASEWAIAAKGPSITVTPASALASNSSNGTINSVDGNGNNSGSGDGKTSTAPLSPASSSLLNGTGIRMGARVAQSPLSSHKNNDMPFASPTRVRREALDLRSMLSTLQSLVPSPYRKQPNQGAIGLMSPQVMSFTSPSAVVKLPSISSMTPLTSPLRSSGTGTNVNATPRTTTSSLSSIVSPRTDVFTSLQALDQVLKDVTPQLAAHFAAPSSIPSGTPHIDIRLPLILVSSFNSSQNRCERRAETR